MRFLLAFIFVAGVLSAQDGAELFNQICANCHNGSVDRAPNREALRNMTADRVLAALESGPMVSMTIRHTPEQRRAIAEFATGRKFSEPLNITPAASAMCRAGTGGTFNMSSGAQWNGWGQNASNSRFQSNPGLAAADVGKLKLKWAFAFPTDLNSYAQATLAGGRLFTGSGTGLVYALDTASGCIHWYFQAESGVRAAFSFARITTPNGPRDATFFGDQAANVYAVDASNGRLLWKTKVDAYSLARITGSPKLHENRLYVPVASGEEGPGAVATYECCRFRGSLVALDIATGNQVWKTYTIDEPRPTKKNAVGTQLWGPSGAPIWSSPVIDTKLNRIYATTGNNYSDPPTRSSDAFVAFDLATGKILWTRQMTPRDAYNAACRLPDKTNCEIDGPDYDFSSSPILVNLAGGKRALVAGQKSAVVHALDPDNEGEVIWSKKIGRGGSMGGVQWGSAADANNLYVALSDIGRIMLTYSQATDADPKVGGGMFALRLSDGEQVWHKEPFQCGTRPRCSPAQSGAVTAIPGVAFSGSVDGHMRAYSTRDGAILWDFDTSRTYQTVNGVAGRGGSLDGPGPAIGGGMVFFNSGYAAGGGQPGNVLLAFAP